MFRRSGVAGQAEVAGHLQKRGRSSGRGRLQGSGAPGKAGRVSQPPGSSPA